MMLCHRALVDELAKRIAVDVVGYNAETDSGNFLEIVNHQNVGGGQIIAGIELAPHHLAALRVVFELGAQRFEHYPLAMFLGGVDVVELLVPFGEVFDLGPFLCGRLLLGCLLRGRLRVGIVCHKRERGKAPI